MLKSREMGRGGRGGGRRPGGVFSKVGNWGKVISSLSLWIRRQPYLWEGHQPAFTEFKFIFVFQLGFCAIHSCSLTHVIITIYHVPSSLQLNLQSLRSPLSDCYRYGNFQELFFQKSCLPKITQRLVPGVRVLLPLLSWRQSTVLSHGVKGEQFVAASTVSGYTMGRLLRSTFFKRNSHRYVCLGVR